MTENDLISLVARLTSRPASDVLLGIGDDAAVVKMPAGKSLVTCTDTLVSGVHFPAGTPARCVGFKSLAVNLSDMAAMAAQPRWIQLSLTLPAADAVWVREFISGFMALADRFQLILIGGDTCSGPLSITVQLMGFAGKDRWLTRGSANPGDLLVVSGELGGAAFALQQLERGQRPHPDLLQRLHEPQPRLHLGQALAAIASSCIDISDGLLLDLERLLQGSGYGASVQLEKLPSSALLAELPDTERWRLQLSGGDDYELCFSVPPSQRRSLQELAGSSDVAVNIIGEVTASAGICCYDVNGAVIQLQRAGFQHFEHSDES